ncbi:MAG: hypothetical protein JNL72_15550 [Flavipsychrobacter sp.]|nr:hypothetical protein [Flavipsychrobacter sp.]
MRLTPLYIFAALWLVSAPAVAQVTRDTVLKGTTIEVIQSYKPEVKMAPKKEYTSALPPADTSRPRFSYEIPQQSLFYTYSSLPLRPLALGKDSVKLPFPNYARLGFGNLNTVLVDAGFGGWKGDNYETAIRLFHLSQRGPIEHQQTASSGLAAEGALHSARYDWHAAFDFKRDQYGLFGYDHNKYEYTQNDSIRSVYTLLRATVDVQPAVGQYRRISYHPSVSVSNYSDNHTASENSFSFNAPFFYNVDSIQFELGISGTATQYTTRPPFTGVSISESNSILQLNPGFRIRQNGFSAHAFIRPTFGKNNTYLLPDIRLSYQIPNSQFILAAGWNAQLRRNTFEELSTYNPYLFNLYNVVQNRADEIFGSIQTNVGSHVNFGARISWWQHTNLPLFLNDTLDGRQFYIVHDRVSALSFQANIRYQVNTTFSLGLNTQFTSFNTTAQQEAWHEPGIRFGADFILRPVPQLTINGYLSVLNGIKAYNAVDQVVNTRGVFDMGAGAEYSFIPRLSAFVQLNNLLNNKYERWLGYNSYGFNIYGGLRLKF